MRLVRKKRSAVSGQLQPNPPYLPFVESDFRGEVMEVFDRS